MGKEWADLLEHFLLSETYSSIGKQIKAEIKNGAIITPNVNDIFRAFLECPLRKLHTVILALDPYPGVNKNRTLVADGIAFSSKTAKSCPKSLEYIYTAIDQSIFNSENTSLTDTYDLTKWANQGILLLNTSLTTHLGKTGVHTKLWKDFTKYTLKKICERKDSLGVILMGAVAQSFKGDIINSTYKILTCSHPASACYTGHKWQHNNVFKELTQFHKQTNNIEIKW